MALQPLSLSEALPDVPLETRELFRQYHRANPIVWELFEVAAMELIQSNEHCGAKAIAEKMRRSAHKEGREYGVDNRFLACYGRMFVFKYPQYRRLFEFRAVKGINQRQAA